ncbi:alpha/beta fold hydrolase [Curtobacterium sp. RRHDQ10]|uniref:alpha/beta fold hydrolase n=1 Tax=Curtobacterium phyllosphaerae TaxID=3413379 RepID=UPI003BF1D2A4
MVPTTSGDVVVHHRLPRPGLPGLPELMVHGVAGSWTTWTPMLAAADLLGRPRGPLVLVDLPGWGSSALPAAGPLSLDQAVSVVEQVTDALGVDRFGVVGHSMGAFIALHLGVALPQRVARIAIVSGTTFAAIDAARRPLHGLVRLPAFVLLRAGFAVLPSISVRLLRALARIGLLPLLAAPVFSHVRRLDPSITRTFLDEVRPVGFASAARAGAAYDPRRWAAIACPVVAVAGADDIFADVADLGRLAAMLPGARTVLLRDCGHFAHVERPVATVLALDGGTAPVV